MSDLGITGVPLPYDDNSFKELNNNLRSFIENERSLSNEKDTKLLDSLTSTNEKLDTLSLKFDEFLNIYKEQQLSDKQELQKYTTLKDLPKAVSNLETSLNMLFITLIVVLIVNNFFNSSFKKL